jgi:hypothetical protein
MVVKSATKKKLMDLGFPEDWAHKLADDRKWDDVKKLWPVELMNEVISPAGAAIPELPSGDTTWQRKMKVDVITNWLLMEQLDAKFSDQHKNIIYLGFRNKEIAYYPKTGSAVFLGHNSYRGLRARSTAQALKWFKLRFSQHTGTAPIGLPADIQEWQSDLLNLLFPGTDKSGNGLQELYRLMLKMKEMELLIIAQSINRANITDMFYDNQLKHLYD